MNEILFRVCYGIKRFSPNGTERPHETGERLSVHSLRHTFASKAIKSGLPIEVVSKLLDHKSVSTTLAVYARFSQNQIDDAVLKINRNNG